MFRSNIEDRIIEQLHKELEQLQKENSQLHTKIDFIEDENKDYKNTLKENQELQNQIKEITEGSMKIIEEKKEEFCHGCNTNDIIDSYNNYIKGLYERLDAYRRDREDLQKENQELKDTNHQLSDRIIELDGIIKELKATNEILAERIEQLQDNIDNEKEPAVDMQDLD